MRLLADLAGWLWLWTAVASALGAEPIDRYALVARHAVVHRTAAPEHFLQVGNGEFAFGFDVTGMQTLDRSFEHPIPLATMSNWGWHSFPNEQGFKYEQTLSEYKSGDRTLTYADRQDSPAGEYFRANPHRLNLARIGLSWATKDEFEDIGAKDLTEIDQRLDLWTGCATSRFKLRGQPVEILTIAHPQRDVVAFRLKSPLLADGRLRVQVRFSYPKGVWGPAIDDFDNSTAHRTTWTPRAEGGVYDRELDEFRYLAAVRTGGVAEPSVGDPHRWRFSWRGAVSGEMCVAFPVSREELAVPTFDETRAAAAQFWEHFWKSGGAIDFAGSADPRAAELERRIVLSQYLTAIQNGSLPPQETGLLCNSWFGKAHLEMHWWHAAHFALWGRPEYWSAAWGGTRRFSQQQAQAIAHRQGNKGARWPKMVGPDGVSSPSGVGEFLVWQQPHLIYMAELAYRANNTPETLAKYAELVDQTAQFMADFVEWDADGRALSPRAAAHSCAGELRSALRARSDVRTRLLALGARRRSDLARARGAAARGRVGPRTQRPAAPHVVDGRYSGVAVSPFTKTADHPSMLAALGVVPATPHIDQPTMLRTAQWVHDHWEWETTWGWDFPMIAMTCARCGDPDGAVDALLQVTPKNTYLPNGHNYQEERLPVYLPGNGGLLTAAAMMAAGWDGAPDGPAPGFPKTDWRVRSEGLRPLP